MTRRIGQVAALATGVQVGLALVATRALSDQVSPVTLALLRYAVGAAVLLPFFARMARVCIRRVDLAPILLLGVGQFAVLIVFLNAGLAHVTAAQGGVIFALFPLVTILLAAALGRERLTWLRSFGAFLSVTGVAICLGVSELPASVWGATLVFAAACVGAICSVFYRPYLQRYPTLQVGTLAMIAAAIALVPGAALEAPIDDLSTLDGLGWSLVAFIGLASGAGYLLWLTALKNTDAGEATVLMGVSPLVAASAGAWFLSEPVGAVFLLGLAVALSGVTLAILSRP